MYSYCTFDPNTLSTDLKESLIKAAVDRLSDTYIVLDIDVIHALVIELLLHVGDGSVVSRDPVDACVLQPPLLHQLTAHLHNQRHKLEDTRGMDT